MARGGSGVVEGVAGAMMIGGEIVAASEEISKGYEIQIMRKESSEAYQKSCLVDQRMGGRYSSPLCGERFPMNARFTNSSDWAAAWKRMLRTLLDADK